MEAEDRLVPVCDTLRSLQCPLLEDASSDWLRQVLLQPSPHRTALLHWCCLQIEPSLAGRLPDPADGAAVGRALADLGFCRRQEPLVQERLSPGRAVSFWSLLLNVTSVLRQEGLSPTTLPASQQSLLSQLCCSEQLQDTLRPRPDLIPADIRQELGPPSEPDSPAAADPASLQPLLAEAQRELSDAQQRLAQLQAGRPRAEDAQLAQLRQLCERTCALLSETRLTLDGLRPKLAAAQPPRPVNTRLADLLAESSDTYRHTEQLIRHGRTVAQAKTVAVPPPPAAPPVGTADNHKLVSDLSRLTAALTI